jgi:hypothetical protein
MAFTSATWNGVTYSIPGQGDTSWSGTYKVDGILISLAANAVNLTLAQTLKTKTLDSSCVLSDATDTTKTVGYSLSGATASTKTTLTFAQTVARTITFQDATDTVVMLATTDTLANKTLKTSCTIGDATDTTKALAFSLSGATTAKTLTIASSHTNARTITLQDATDTVVMRATTDTLSNKQIGDPTDITKAIAFTLSGATTAKTLTLISAHTNNRSLTFPDTTDTLTGKATTDILTNKTINASSNTFQAIDEGQSIWNATIAASVGANALTVALKTKAGTDASATDTAFFSFRNATATTGTYTVVSVTGASSVVAPDAQSLGLVIGTPTYLYVYVINNAGTAELALSATAFDEGTVQTTVAIASAATATTMYSTTARSNVPVRLIGRVLINLGASTHWSNSPTEVSMQPFQFQRQFAVGAAQASSSTITATSYTTLTNTVSVTFVATRTGLYHISVDSVAQQTVCSTVGYFHITATAGSPSIVQSFDSVNGIGAAEANGYGAIYPAVIASLSAGTTYGFTLLMKTDSGGSVVHRPDFNTSGTAMVAEFKQ